MNDRQRSKVQAAEEAIWFEPENAVLTPHEVERLVAQACERLGVCAPAVHITDEDGDLVLKDGSMTVPPWAMRPLGILHDVAHLAVDRVFPDHGTEYVQALLSVCDEPLRAKLHAALEAQKVRLTAESSNARSVKDLDYYVSVGRSVEMVFDDPPEVVVAEHASKVHDVIHAAGAMFDLRRLRYVSAA